MIRVLAFIQFAVAQSITDYLFITSRFQESGLKTYLDATLTGLGIRDYKQGGQCLNSSYEVLDGPYNLNQNLSALFSSADYQNQNGFA